MMTFIKDMKLRLAGKFRYIIRSEVDNTIEVILPQLLDFHSSSPEIR
jgi:hypothetical protein